MSHIGARVLAVLHYDKPYELRDIDGSPISAGGQEISPVEIQGA